MPRAPIGNGRRSVKGRSRTRRTSRRPGFGQLLVAAEITPRGVASTDAEIVWLVNAEAKEGKDYQIDRLTALWDITMMEDKWIVENNHLGILSGRYRAGWYATTETGPSRLVKWYMTEMVPTFSAKGTS